MNKATRSAAFVFLFVLISGTLSGCASNLMRPASDTKVAAAKDGNANVVFMRSSFVAGAIGVELFEVVNGELKFIGQLPSGNKIVHETTPGEKVYMAYGTAADFMRAHVDAGKTYYSIVRPNWGTGGFAPTPVRTSLADPSNVKSAEFTSIVASTNRIEANESAAGWFQENKARYQEIYKEYWSRWQRKNEDEKDQRTLRAEDGVR